MRSLLRGATHDTAGSLHGRMATMAESSVASRAGVACAGRDGVEIVISLLSPILLTS